MIDSPNLAGMFTLCFLHMHMCNLISKETVWISRIVAPASSTAQYVSEENVFLPDLLTIKRNKSWIILVSTNLIQHCKNKVSDENEEILKERILHMNCGICSAEK